jgi:acyl-CoA reductase-like NAD-dependent aldehyde dehydrogenase
MVWVIYFDPPSTSYLTLASFFFPGGWADKIQGKVIEVDETKLAYTRHEPIGVVVSAYHI